MRVLPTKWRPQQHQEPVLGHDTGVDILVGGVGSGKSDVGAFKFLRWVFQHPRRKDGRPTQGLILGKDFRNAGDSQFLKLREQVARLDLPAGRVIVKELGPGLDHPPTLFFSNGVRVCAFTGKDTNATRSYEADFLWADEAEEMDALSFVTALGRLRSAEAVRAIATSNPAGGGWIYPMLAGDYPEWDEIREANDVRFFRWASRQNKFNDPKVMRTLRAAYRATSPGLELQELGGRFLGTAEAPGSQILQYVRAFVGKVALKPGRERAVVVGADLGKSEDFVWLTAANVAGVVLAQDRFNMTEVDVSEDAYWPFVADRLIQFAVTWGASRINLDLARGGDQFAAMLRGILQARKIAIEVVGVDTSSPGKRTDLLEALSMAIGMGRWTVPTAWELEGQSAVSVAHVETLRVEFKRLQKRMHGSQARYAHPTGGHDDGIVSNALAWNGLATRPTPQRPRVMPASKVSPQRRIRRSY